MTRKAPENWDKGPGKSPYGAPPKVYMDNQTSAARAEREAAEQTAALAFFHFGHHIEQTRQCGVAHVWEEPALALIRMRCNCGSQFSATPREMREIVAAGKEYLELQAKAAAQPATGNQQSGHAEALRRENERLNNVIASAAHAAQLAGQNRLAMLREYKQHSAVQAAEPAKRGPTIYCQNDEELW